ncbi:MAG TPA: hypothetical protein VKX17_09855 [Planctomycetota bacterium]|nr:hypothetical protein [Planctomycetota bacterium]
MKNSKFKMKWLQVHLSTAVVLMFAAGGFEKRPFVICELAFVICHFTDARARLFK